MSGVLGVEALKLRRAGVVRVTAVVLALACPLLAAGMTRAAAAGGESQLSVKAAALITRPGWPGYLDVVGQILTVAVLLGGGVVTSWVFGREFVQGTVTGLFATATPRWQVAAAKLAAVIAALVSICLVGVLLAIALGPLAGLPRPDAAVWPAAGRVLTGALLMALLTTPLAWVASARRGYLPAIGALLGLIVVTQIVTAAGAGGWFPYATPSLWLGMGGPAAAAAVTAPQLAAAVPVSAAGAAATIWWWRRAELS